ncbi:MAG: 2-succinyl-5-enolpyruvyl-6-hydroxy-3-cyclohexene-1-carboxylic-acid synthase [Crocinitomicaceae bacterium]
MQYSNKIGVQLILQKCSSHGVKNLVFSPGSRNAPFVISINDDSDFKTYTIHDERSAAFFALGIAQQLNEPVAIICTSGSAALNYYPAVAEAYYQSLPLVVITADRPDEWVNQGDGQTIVQNEVFKNHIRYSVNINDSSSHENYFWKIERELDTAFSHCNKNWKGPIHINIGLSEPLYETINEKHQTNNHFELISSSFNPTTEEKNLLGSIWKNSTKRLILCGQIPKNIALENQLKELATDTSVAVLVENTSNLFDQSFSHCIDRTLNEISEDEILSYKPDLLITLGGAVVSKRIKSFLRKNKPKHHWKIGYEFPYMDTYQCLTQSIEAHPEHVFSFINQIQFERHVSTFGNRWKQKDFIAQNSLPDFYESLPYCDLKVFETILDYIPENSHLHMGNSSVVRYCQLFDPIKSVKYWSNRGTSGIDGCTSTAAGAAISKQDEWHTLISGDISFFYDSNALWNSHLTPNLRIFLINNDGGDIFNIIPGPKSVPQYKRFIAPHGFRAKQLCEAFDIEYFEADSIEAIECQLESFFNYESSGRPKVMEISTRDIDNSGYLNEFWKRNSLI